MDAEGILGQAGENTLRIDLADAGRPPRVSAGNSSGAIRVRGVPDQEYIEVRAFRPNGEPVPVALVADIERRGDEEIAIRARPEGDLQRHVRRVRESFDFGRGDMLDRVDIGGIIEAMTALKSLGRNLEVATLEIDLPQACDLHIKTASGAVEVERIDGTVHAQTASGQITCAGIGGKVVAKSASGEIRASGVTGAAYLQSVSGRIRGAGIDGNLVIQTASGDATGRDIAGQIGFKSLSGGLTIRESRLTGLYLNTTSGDSRIEAALGPGDYEARSVSGAIRLQPQPSLNAILRGRTVSGSFRCALPVRHSDDDWRADLDDERGDERDEEFDELGTADGPLGSGIAIGGIHIDDRGVRLPGIRIDDDGIDIPALRLKIRGDRDQEREQRRKERRRGRNRWEFLIGDPVAASAGLTRLRVRTVSGSLSIAAGSADDDRDPATRRDNPVELGAEERAAAPSTPGATATRAWPDPEIWPHAAPAAGVTPLTPAAPEPPALTDIPVTTAPGMPADAETETDPPADPTATAMTEATPPPDHDRARLEILEALERREITPDEALLLLRQLDE